MKRIFRNYFLGPIWLCLISAFKQNFSSQSDKDGPLFWIFFFHLTMFAGQSLTVLLGETRGFKYYNSRSVTDHIIVLQMHSSLDLFYTCLLQKHPPMLVWCKAIKLCLALLVYTQEIFPYWYASHPSDLGGVVTWVMKNTCTPYHLQIK